MGSQLILVGNFCGTLTRLLVWGALQLVLIVGAKLQHIIIDLAIEVRGGLKKIDLDDLDDGLKKADHPGAGVEVQPMKPRDDLFWFSRPKILIKLIHFILFQVPSPFASPDSNFTHSFSDPVFGSLGER
jgi:hypothetical protein